MFMKNLSVQHIRFLCLLIIFISFLGCERQSQLISEWQKLDTLPGQLAIDYPQDNTLFPPDIAAPTMRWQDHSKSTEWLIIASRAQKHPLVSTFVSKNQWLPDSLDWQRIKNAALEEAITITVLGTKGRHIMSGESIRIRTSQDSVSASLFYRAVPLPFIDAVHNLDQIRWHLGDISSRKPAPALLEDLPLCGNCHTFTADGNTMAMDVDYANDKGSYVVTDIEKETVLTPEKIITWSDYRRQDGENTFGLLSQISPDGRYVASTVKDRSIFVATEGLAYSQLFFPIKGIIAIYDRKTGEFHALPGADNPNYVQSNPNWSPDGKFIYFARASVYHSKAAEQSSQVLLPTEIASEFIEGKRDFKYSIYRIPFNDGRGGTPKPVPGASHNGKSNYFPRISPDGKWMVFCQADNFMLLQPDSKLKIMPTNGGTVRELACNTDSMNSWHSWSPNGRWLVFASKMRSPYTDMLLTHIDENGHSSPPIVLEHLSFDNYAINIPEFVDLNGKPWRKIVDAFSDQAHYYFTIGRSKMGEKKLKEAMAAFQKSIELDSTYAKSYVFKGHLEFANELYEQALNSYENAVRYIKDDATLYQNLGTTYYKLRQHAEAIAAFNKSLKLDSHNIDAYIGRALVRAKRGSYKNAIRDLSQAVQLNDESAKAYHERGVCYGLLEQWDKAAKDLKKAADLNPDNAQTWEKVGIAYHRLAEYKQAIQAFDQAINLDDSQHTNVYQLRGDSKYKMKDFQGALSDYTAAIEKNPNFGIAYYRRGLVYIVLEQRQSACQDFRRAYGLGVKKVSAMLQKYCQ